MSRPPTSRKAFAWSTLATICILANPCELFAQVRVPQVAAPSALEIERERTRARIGEVTADQSQELDSSFSLGERLSTDMQQVVSRIDAARPRNPQPERPRSAQGLQTDRWSSGTESSKPPAPERMRRRAAKQDPPTTNLAFTPDFSRQTLSFAELAGMDVIDLPRLDDTPESKISNQPTLERNTWGLPDIVLEGLAFSPVLQQAVAQRESARARRKQAEADWFPSAAARVTGGEASTTTDGSPTVSSSGYRNNTLRITQPLFNRVLSKALTSTQHDDEAVQLRESDSRQTVALSLTQATVALAANRLTINFADELEVQLSNVLRYLETRAQAGATSLADLERARTRVLAARQTRLDQQAAYKSSLFELERLIDQSPKALRLPYLNQLPPLPQTQTELRNLVHDNSAILKAMRQDIAAQEAQVASQYGRLLPTLGLSAERDFQKNTAGETPSQTDSRLLAVMSWQFSLGGKEFYVAREAEAELRNRKAKFEEETHKIDQALEADFSLLQSTTLRIAAGESEYRAAWTVVQAVQEQLKTGRMGNLLEALDASDRQFSARSRQIQALSQQITAQAQLLRQLGALTQVQASADAQ